MYSRTLYLLISDPINMCVVWFMGTQPVESPRLGRKNELKERET